MKKRRPTGTVEWVPASASEPGHYKARVRLADGTRPWVHYPPEVTEAEARARAQLAERIAKREGRVSKQTAAAERATETCDEWWSRYFAWRKEKGQASVKDSRARVTKWIAPKIGTRPMAGITEDDCRAIVQHLDDAVAAHEISWKTATNAWGECTSAFSQACSSKNASLVVRGDNPTTNVRGPDRGELRSKPVLYPNEGRTKESATEDPILGRWTNGTPSGWIAAPARWHQRPRGRRR